MVLWASAASISVKKKRERSAPGVSKELRWPTYFPPVCSRFFWEKVTLGVVVAKLFSAIVFRRSSLAFPCPGHTQNTCCRFFVTSHLRHFEVETRQLRCETKVGVWAGTSLLKPTICQQANASTRTVWLLTVHLCALRTRVSLGPATFDQDHLPFFRE